MPSRTLDPRRGWPPITPETKFLSFDVEANGLHGPAFAVGAVLMRADEKVLDEFTGRSPIKGEVDPWVKANVLPAIKNMPEDYPNAKALREAFWQWYRKADADYVVVSNGYPVEMRFLIAAQEDDLEERYWQHPLPLLELNSLLLQVNAESRHGLVADKLTGHAEAKHHPRYDAWVSVLSAIKALKLSGRLKA